MNYDVIIVASGKGIRANLGYNKAFYRMKDGKTVLEHSASLFNEDALRIRSATAAVLELIIPLVRV